MLMFGGHGDQRDRGVIEPDGDGHRVMVASAGVKQIDAVAEVLFDADAGVDVLIKRQSRPAVTSYPAAIRCSRV